MVNSVNTNIGALVALQNLNQTNSQLETVQNRVSTGFRVSSAIDDASSFAIAQGIRGDIKAYAAVSQSLANGKGVAEVALSALTSISDLAGDIQAKITQGANAGNTTAQQVVLANDYSQLINQKKKKTQKEKKWLFVGIIIQYNIIQLFQQIAIFFLFVFFSFSG
eukprot:TRINITY_DN6028_c2_g1_i11.p1 TRINITY_DN6028_c2_g1~~TRINITY_DN6028_c2_g1_i11.p1  ORF type:complete len:165 (+),score=0.69 TRINITY_DN6028_c2_g1_i11:57-551(+)